MIFIIHGDNFPKSRDNILKIQNKLGVDNKIEAGVADLTPNQLQEQTLSFDIFSKAPFVVLDISKAGRKNLKDYVSVLKEIPKRTNVVILSNKSLSKTNVFIKAKKELSAKEIHNTQIPSANIFKFINYVFDKNRSRAYKELRNLMLDSADPFYLFSMLVYGLRNLALAKFESPSFNKMAPFTKSKAQKQANDFTDKQILKLYESFYKIDKNVKTGKLSPEILVPYAIEKVME